MESTYRITSWDAFRFFHREGGGVPLVLELPMPEPQLVPLLHALQASRPLYLLYSPCGPPETAGRTLFSFDPFGEIRIRAGTARVRLGDREEEHPGVEPIPFLRGILERYRSPGYPYACGGALGVFTYDFKNYLEKLPDTVEDDHRLAEVTLVLVDHVWTYDHARRMLVIGTTVRGTSRPHRDYEEGCRRLMELLRWVRTPMFQAATPTAYEIGFPRSNLTYPEYERMILRAKTYIRRGHIYQANLSQRFTATFKGQAFQLFRRLAEINPSPFSCYLDFGDHQVVSSSPERLVRCEGGRVETRPIAGTRPRVDREEELDRTYLQELVLSEKEKAEHLMIVDMARNDLGRVCAYGTVRPHGFAFVEEYSHVRHLVSSVRGRLRDDADEWDLLAAVFPGASITGVPKVRYRRGIYCGSAGYLSFSGEMDLNILIRTFLVRGAATTFQVGGGIVADSEPGREFDETLHKAEALFEAARWELPPLEEEGVEEKRRGRAAPA
jgi:anthranilate synthase component 1